LADDIEKEFDVQVTFQKGKLHSFDVLVGDELIFSKEKEGRLPESEEIIELLREHLGG
jgi:hypothetical protein